MEHTTLRVWVKILNAIDLIGIAVVMIAAFFFQFVLKELPCPLCLLQRVGLLAIAFGFLLNVRYEIRPLHYAFALQAALFTGLVAMRQVALHVVPGTGAYGLPFLGFHLYTWLVVLCFVVVIYTTIMLAIPGQYLRTNKKEHISEEKLRWLEKLSHIAFMLLLVVSIANVISGIAECGFQACPENPVAYKL